ncbi:tail protein X [Sphingobium yanoikuyae]|uniref:tail protein X n=1 Tax=Sphingobium yanoikuyae TaxID=13690 RepID=UPI0008477AD9|nr:tail protein X [Sphingobium yanoikuyae]
MQVRAVQDESVDQLVWRINGGGPAVVQAVLAANIGLAGEGPQLAEGRIVTIPDMVSPTAEPVALVNLWD